MPIKNVITTINADIKKRNAYMDKVEVVKHDTIRFIINVLDGGKPFTEGQMAKIATATLVNLRRDGVPVTVVGEVIGGNQIVYDIPRKATDVLGNVRAMAQMYDAEGHRISSLSFSYTVVEDLSGGNPPVLEEEQSLIEVVLGDGPLVIQNAIDATQSANEAAQLAHDETELLSEMKSDVVQATNDANEAATRANTSADNADTATTNANEATDRANTAAENAEQRTAELESVDATQFHDRLKDIEQFVDEDTGKVYRYRLKQKDGHMVFAYEEVM